MGPTDLTHLSMVPTASASGHGCPRLAGPPFLLACFCTPALKDPPPRPAQNIFILTAQIPIKPIRRLSSELATCRASLVSTQAGLSEGSVQDGQVLELVVPGDTG